MKIPNCAATVKVRTSKTLLNPEQEEILESLVAEKTARNRRNEFAKSKNHFSQVSNSAEDFSPDFAQFSAPDFAQDFQTSPNQNQTQNPRNHQTYQTKNRETETEKVTIRETAQNSLFAPAEVLESLNQDEISRETNFILENWDVKKEIYDGEIFDNAKTAIMEALSASGFLSQMEYSGAPEEISRILIQRAVNYLSLPLHPHERKRAMQELREAVLVRRVAREIAAGNLAESVNISTLSIFPESLDDKTAEKIGYRPKNKKGMVRNWSFEKLSGGEIKIKIDQLSYTNLGNFAGNLVDNADFANFDFDSEKDVAFLQNPRLYDARFLPSGIIDIARALDFNSGKRFGEIPDEKTLTYENLRRESLAREKKVADFYGELADFQRKNPDNLQGYANKVREILLRICTQNPQMAKETFGENSVATFEIAHAQANSGDYAGAFSTISGNSANFDTVVICGASSRAQGVEFTAAQQAQMANMSESEKAEFIKKIQKDTEKKWHFGYCRVPNCPCAKTGGKVGECEICEKCEKLFDRYDDNYDKVLAANERIYNTNKKSAANFDSAPKNIEQNNLRKTRENVRKFHWSDEIFTRIIGFELYGGEISDDAEFAKKVYDCR